MALLQYVLVAPLDEHLNGAQQAPPGDAPALRTGVASPPFAGSAHRDAALDPTNPYGLGDYTWNNDRTYYFGVIGVAR